MFGKLRTSVVVALGATAAFVVFLVVTSWAGAPVNQSNLLVPTTVGLANGALYAMSAAGLVVVYNTTGVFNFAQGAIGVFAAFLYWELHEKSDGIQLPALVALVVVVAIVAPLLGIVLDIVLMRRVRTAPLVVQLMVTVGLMVFLLVLVGRIWPATEARSIDHFFGSDGFTVGSTKILWHRALVVVVAVAIAVFLRLLLFRSRLGTAMRAVVDNRDLAALNGARPDVVSGFAWALGSSLAALAGILIAPEVEFNPTNLNAIIFVALAAAAFGGLRSLPLAVVGGLLIGLLERHSTVWFRFNDFPFATRAVAPILLFIVLVALPQARLEIGRVASNLRPRERLTSWWEGIIGGLAILLGIVVLSGGYLHFGIWDPGSWDQIALNNATGALTLGLIGLSLVPLTGWAGQVNFAPLAFAGFGAVLFLKLDDGSGNFWLIPLIGLLCAPLGAIVALPAARLKGLYLALMSMAFAQLMAVLFFPHKDTLKTGRTGTQFAPLELFGYTFDGRRGYLILVAGVFGAALIGLVLLRRSRFGRRWVALNDSQAASATVGVNIVLTKVVVYATSAAIAGMAGVFWATNKGNLDAVRDFDLLIGFEIVLLMAAAGMSFAAAGLFLSFRLVFEGLADRLDATGNVPVLVWLLDQLAVFGPGLLAIGMVVNQRGAIFEMGRGFAPLLPWRKDAREEQAAEKAAKVEPEVGGLGLEEPFTNEAVLDLDRRLGIIGDVTPPDGYHHGVTRSATT